MESIVEDVEDQRETEGSPANSQSCKKLVGFDDLKRSRGVDQSGVFSIRNQRDDCIDSQANKRQQLINNSTYSIHFTNLI